MNNNWTKDSNLISSNQIEKLSKLYSINERFYLSLNEVLSSIFIGHCCLFHLLVQKIFLLRSNFFEHVQYFLKTVKFFDYGQKQDFTL